MKHPELKLLGWLLRKSALILPTFDREAHVLRRTIQLALCSLVLLQGANAYADIWSDTRDFLTDPIGTLTGRNEKTKKENENKRATVALLQKQWMDAYTAAEQSRIAQNTLRSAAALVELSSAVAIEASARANGRCASTANEFVYSCRRALADFEVAARDLAMHANRVVAALADAALPPAAKTPALVERAKAAQAYAARMVEDVARTKDRVLQRDFVVLRQALNDSAKVRAASCSRMVGVVQLQLKGGRTAWDEAQQRIRIDEMQSSLARISVYSQLGETILAVCDKSSTSFQSSVGESKAFVNDPRTQQALAKAVAENCKLPQVEAVAELAAACKSGYYTSAFYFSLGSVVREK